MASDETAREPMREARMVPALTAEELEAFRQTADDARHINTEAPDLIAFLIAHADHRLEVYDEYGRLPF